MRVRQWQLDAGVALGLAALSLAASWHVGENAFLRFWDDPQYVTDNPPVLGGLRASGLRWALTTTHMGGWHPLTWASLMLDVSLFGADPAALHRVNALLHAVCVALLYLGLLALFRVAPGGGRMPGLALRCAAVALLWGLHPLRVESFAWLPERKDLLSGLFFFALLWTYAAHVRAPGRATRLGLTACLVASLLSKATAVTAPLLLLLLDVWPLRRVAWPTPLRPAGALRALLPRVSEKAPLFALAGACIPLSLIAQQSAGALAAREAASLSNGIATATVAAVQYLRQLVWPHGLAAFYPHPSSVLEGAEWGELALRSAALLASLFLAAWLARRRQPALLFGLVWFAIALAPVSGTVRIGAQGWADRYTYIPLVGPTLAAVWLLGGAIERLPGRLRVAGRIVVLCAVAAATLALGVQSYRQVGTWSDSHTLWSHAREVVPLNYRASMMLGGLEQEDGRPDRARVYFYEAYRTAPNVGVVRMALGQWHFERGEFAAAVPHLEAAALARPDDPQVHATLGFALLNLGRRDEARPHAERAAALAPEDPAARRLMRLLGP